MQLPNVYEPKPVFREVLLDPSARIPDGAVAEYPQTSLELLRAKIRRAAGRGAGGRAGARHGVTAGPQHRAAAARAQPDRF
jgi:hypothetical protein